MERLKAMFSHADAPFFNFATPVVLEPLGDAFFAHQTKAFRRSFGRALDEDAARHRFEAVDRNPELVQRWLNVLGQNPDLTPDEATRATDEQFAVGENYFGDWRAMTRLQRQFLRMVAEGVRGLFGKGGAARITPQEVPGRTTRQTAQRWLECNGFLEKWDGNWTIVDPAFERWILLRPEADFL